MFIAQPLKWELIAHSLPRVARIKTSVQHQTGMRCPAIIAKYVKIQIK